MRYGKSKQVSNKVDDFIKDLEWSILIAEIPDTDTENLEERLERLRYELDMFNPDKVIGRILKR